MRMKHTPCLLLFALALLPTLPASAAMPWNRAEEEEAELAKHVADLLREPNRQIAKAQNAINDGNLEEAIRLFENAYEMILNIETSENTTGSAFSSLRLKKFHCTSMLDALALKQAGRQDRRQAVTDTSDLEAKLKAERAKIKADAEKENARPEIPKPPTLAERLHEAREKARAAEASIRANHLAVEETQTEVLRTKAAFRAAAKAHTAADAAVFALSNAPAADAGSKEDQARETRLKEAQEHLTQAKIALDNARKAESSAAERHRAALEAAAKARTEAKQLQADADLLAKAYTLEQDKRRREQDAARKAKEDEEKRLQAEILLKKQAEAAEAARLRQVKEKLAADKKAKAEAEAKAKEQAEAVARQAKAKAEADTKEKAAAVGWCRDLWELKRIDRLETELTQNAARWPDEPAFLLLLAKLRLLQNRADDALELAAMLPSGTVAGRDARLVAAGAYMAKNRPLDAMKLLESVLKEDPKNISATFNMAAVMLRLPDIDPKHDIAASYYIRSVRLGGKRSPAMERRLNME